MAGGFEALGLAPELVRAVTEDLGYLLPTNVQVQLCGLHCCFWTDLTAVLDLETRYPQSSLARLAILGALCVLFCPNRINPDYC